MNRPIIVAATGHELLFKEDVPSATIGQLIVALLRHFIPSTAPNRSACRPELLLSGRGTLPPTDPPPMAEGGAPAELYLFLDQQWLAYFPAPSKQELSRSTLERQREAFRMLLMPVQRHSAVAVAQHEAASALLPTVREQVEEVARTIPASLDALRAVRVVGDADTTLLDHVVDYERKLTECRDAVEKAAAEIDASARTLAALSDEVTALHDAQPPAACSSSSQSQGAALQAEHDALLLAGVERLKATKALLRKLERCRQGDKKAQSLLDVARRDVRRISMVHSLPTAYREAYAVARERLTFRRAVKRVLNTLQPEVDRINGLVRRFKAEFGERFPVNILPGVDRPVIIGDVAFDSVAAALDPHEPDTDEDPASELLQRLGLGGGGGGGGGTTSPPDEERHVAIESLRAEIAELAGALRCAKEEGAVAVDEAGAWRLRCNDLEEKARQLQEDRDQLQEVNAILITRIESLQQELLSHQAAHQMNHSGASSARHARPAANRTEAPARGALSQELKEQVLQAHVFHLETSGTLHRLLCRSVPGVVLRVDSSAHGYQQLLQRAQDSADGAVRLLVITAQLVGDGGGANRLIRGHSDPTADAMHASSALQSRAAALEVLCECMLDSR